MMIPFKVKTFSFLLGALVSSAPTEHCWLVPARRQGWRK